MDIQYLLLTLFLLVGNFFDFRSTFIAIETNPNAYEKNVFMRFFVSRGKLFTYLMTSLVNLLIAGFCFILKTSSDPNTRTSIWWLPLIALALFHIYLALRNRRFYGKMQ